MKETQLIMGMPITVDIIDDAPSWVFSKVFSYLRYIDETFSTYKSTSEISRINAGVIDKKRYSNDMKIIFSLAQQTKRESFGYFDIWRNGIYDPSGIVKGWAIYEATKLLQKYGFTNYYIDAGGDIQTSGTPRNAATWRVGIRNPFNPTQIVKTIAVTGGMGVATSGTYERGQHIYNPHIPCANMTNNIVSLTVIGPNIYEADRFATAAFAMGNKGIYFIECLPKFEGYMIDTTGKATFTTNFVSYATS